MKRSSPLRHGFTLMELSLALALSAVVALGAVSFTSVMTSPSLKGENKLLDADARGRGFMDNMIRLSEDVGYWASGTGATADATLLLWSGDNLVASSTVANDFSIQLHELSVVTYDAAAQEVVLFRPRPWEQLSTAEQSTADDVVTDVDFNSAALASQVAGSSWVQRIVVFGNSRPVTAARFGVSETGERLRVDYELELAQPAAGAATKQVAGSITLVQRNLQDDWSESRLLRRGA